MVEGIPTAHCFSYCLFVNIFSFSSESGTLSHNGAIQFHFQITKQ